MTTKVYLRKKIISKGRESLYLDFYPAISHPKTGKTTRREFLGMYVFIVKKEIKKSIKHKEAKVNATDFKSKNEYNKKNNEIKRLQVIYKTLRPLTPFEEAHNRETYRIAQAIMTKRQNALNKPEIYSSEEREKLRIKELGERDFIEYFEQLAQKRKGKNQGIWFAALKRFKSFTGDNLRFVDLNEKLLNDFREHLLESNISNNTASTYFSRLKTTLKQAYKDGIIQLNLNSRIEAISEKPPRREYLTMSEVRKLAQTPCKDDQLKHASLFAALTGLRFSDIEKLTWKEVVHEDNGYKLRFTMQKTKLVEDLPISDEAFLQLGKIGEPDDKIFNDLRKSVYNNSNLKNWIKDAGINKEISFHSFRHSFAVNQLYEKTDIYTLSKLLGHKDLKTTEVYAEIVSERKREAANKLRLSL